MNALFSLYALLALARWVTPLELLRRAFFAGPPMTSVLSNASQWAGVTTLASGSATVTVSTNQVNSDSLILHSILGVGNVSSGQFKSLEVKSINPGAHFILGTPDGQAMARDSVLMWELRKTS